MRLLSILLIGVVFSLQLNAQSKLDKRIDSLINIMTIDEKLAQLYNNSFMTTPDNSRLGIPGFVMDDGPHGVRFNKATAFPTGIAMASTWDIPFLESLGIALGTEFWAYGKHQALGPCIDIARDPRAGRTAESAGEDTYLAGHVGAAVSKGIQTTPVIATIKHFMGESKQAYRHSCNEILTQRLLMEQYGYNFRYAMQESGAMSMMSSYNLINGNKGAESIPSLTTNLRNNWGFPFYVVSDWGAIWDSKKAIIAGTEICMGADNYKNDLPGLVQSESVSISVIDEAVRRVLKTKILAGMLDYYPAGNTSMANTPEHIKIALDGARKSIILLKNQNNILPLSKDVKKIAIIGPNASKGNLNCFGSSETTPPYSISLKQGIENKVGATKVLYSKGCDINSTNISLYQSALDIAAVADIVIFAGGLDETQEGEAYDIGNDRKNNSSVLPGKQLDLINKLAEVNSNIVVVLQSGGVCSIDASIDNIQGLVYSFYAGQEAGTAIADVLFGDYNPAGRMPVTMPKNDSQLPVWDDDFTNDFTCGYRWFDEKGYTPQYFFGFGLSYSTFSYSNISINPSNAVAGSAITVSLEVENTSDKDGDEVVELYVTNKTSSIWMPKKELKGFKRILIPANTKKLVSFTLNAEDLYYFNETDNKYNVESGEYTISVGGSSDNLPLTGILSLTEGPAKPDLKIAEVFTMPRYPIEGQKVSFYALVKNLGNTSVLPASPFSIDYTINNQKVASSELVMDTILPGQVKLIASDSTWTTSQAEISSLSATADVNNIIDEWIEDNNSYTKKFQIFSKALDLANFNLAYKKQVVVSTIEKAGLEGENAVDGSSSSRWASAFQDNQYIIIDLGQATLFDKIVLNWEAAYASKYNVLISQDSISWDTIAKVSNTKLEIDTIYSTNTAQYIRIDCIKRATAYGFSIYEIQVLEEQESEINHVPVSVAGTNKTISFPTHSLTLDGSASSDLDKDKLSYSWWQLSGPNNATFSSDTSAITDISNLLEGKYSFVLTVSDGELSSSSIVTVIVNRIVTGISSNELNEISVYPIPANEIIHISFPEGAVSNLVLYDIMGKELLSKAITNSAKEILNIAGIKAGMYLLKLSGGSESTVRKIIIN